MSFLNRMLREDEQAELDALNEAVDEAIRKRTAWLDAKMAEVCTLKVGDDIYDLDSGRRLGIVTRLYRYWGPHDPGGECRDPRYDKSCSVEVEYSDSPGSRDNTSRHAGARSFGTKEEAAREAQRRLDRLR